MFNYYIMKNLANCSPSRDMSIFRFELDCTSYVGKTRRCITPRGEWFIFQICLRENANIFKIV